MENQQEPKQYSTKDENWRGRFNPESLDPNKSSSITIAGIVFLIVVVAFTLFGELL